MSVEPVLKPRSRRFRFGLRGGCVLIALIALSLGVLDYGIRRPYREEQRAADALTRLGGRVILVEDTQGWVPKHLSPKLFDMKIAAVIDLSDSRVTDDDLVHLRAFRHFGGLNLSDTEISNAALEDLRQVVAGRFIDLSRTRITDTSALFSNRCINHPSGLKLSGNRVAGGTILGTNGGWCPLQELDLSETDADDTTLKKLPKGLVNLAKLDLSGTKVTDAGLDDLKKIEGLTSLGLSRTQVTPEGIARLKASWKGRMPLTVLTGPTKIPIVPYASIPK